MTHPSAAAAAYPSRAAVTHPCGRARGRARGRRPLRLISRPCGPALCGAPRGPTLAQLGGGGGVEARQARQARDLPQRVAE